MGSPNSLPLRCQAGLRAKDLDERHTFAQLLVLRTRLLPIWGQLRLFAQDVKKNRSSQPGLVCLNADGFFDNRMEMEIWEEWDDDSTTGLHLV